MNVTLAAKGMQDLIQALQNNVWPQYFLEELLGLSAEWMKLLPFYAFRVLALFFASGLCVLILKLWKKQIPFSDRIAKLVDWICVVVAIMWVWIAPQFIAQAQADAAHITGSFAFTPAGWQWILDMLLAWFEPMFIVILLGAISTLPLWTALRYLKEYKLWGVFWAVHDLCFAVLPAAAAVLSMRTGDLRWYLVMVPAVLLVWLEQRGGTDVK